MGLTVSISTMRLELLMVVMTVLIWRCYGKCESF